MTDFEVVCENDVLTPYSGSGARYEINPQSGVLAVFDGNGSRIHVSPAGWLNVRGRAGQRLRDPDPEACLARWLVRRADRHTGSQPARAARRRTLTPGLLITQPSCAIPAGVSQAEPHVRRLPRLPIRRRPRIDRGRVAHTGSHGGDETVGVGVGLRPFPDRTSQLHERAEPRTAHPVVSEVGGSFGDSQMTPRPETW